jgi:hypothetical protein
LVDAVHRTVVAESQGKEVAMKRRHALVLLYVSGVADQADSR